jgi:DNA-binding transcriptional ArsR family regulator
MMSAPARREYLQAIHGRYRQAAHKDQGAILDEFCRVTGYHRKYALRLLNGLLDGGAAVSYIERCSTGETMATRGRHAAPAVDHALSILETLAAAQEIGVTDLARKLDMGKNSVHRLLAALAARGYVEKNPNTDRAIG